MEPAKKKNKLILSVWEGLSAEEKAQYRGLPGIRRLVNHSDSPRSGALQPRRRTNKRRTQLPTMQIESTYICDEPDTATTLDTNMIGAMSLIDYSLYAPQIFSVFIGDLKAANDQSLLLCNRITAVLTLGSSNKPKTYPSVSSGYLSLPLEDSPNSELFNFYEAIYRFLSCNLEQGNVLIHCFRGRTRSCAVAVYFLLRALKMPYSLAKEIVYTSRNGYFKMPRHFENQLKTAERLLAN